MNRRIISTRLKPDLFLVSLVLLWCSVAALAQSPGQSANSPTPVSIRGTHLLGFENAASVLMGVTASGYYVRSAQSPTIGGLVETLRNWPTHA